MITPDDRVPQDDLQGEDKDEQMSQQDIHSNGFNESDKPLDDDDTDESGALAQAYEAAESSFTLDTDDDDLDEDND